MRYWLVSRIVVLTSAVYALDAIGTRALAGRAPTDVLLAIAGAILLAVFVWSTTRLARITPLLSQPRLMSSAGLAAGLGALGYSLWFGFSVRWGGGCNQCTPIRLAAFLIPAAGLLAAAAAFPLALVARRNHATPRRAPA